MRAGLFPRVKTGRKARVVLWLLRRVYRKQWYVQFRKGGAVYILRTPWEDSQ